VDTIQLINKPFEFSNSDLASDASTVAVQIKSAIAYLKLAPSETTTLKAIARVFSMEFANRHIPPQPS
jgi:hypothetical protein